MRLAHVLGCSHPTAVNEHQWQLQAVRAPRLTSTLYSCVNALTSTLFSCINVTCCSFCLPFSFNPVAKVPASVMQPDLAYIVWVFYLSKVMCDV